MTEEVRGKPQVAAEELEQPGSRRDPEERTVRSADEVEEKNLDKTLADSFPTSDPPSSIPAPSANLQKQEKAKRLLMEEQLAELPIGTWAAFSIENNQLVGTGPSRDEAVRAARNKGHNILNLVRIQEQGPLGLAS